MHTDLCQILLRKGWIDADRLAALLSEWKGGGGAASFEAFLLEAGVLDADRLAEVRGEPDTRRIGRFQCLRRLGSGGMGTVFLARHPELARPVAVKVLSASVAGDEDSRARFEREYRALSRVAHANVVRIHDVDRSDGTPFYVMEYYANGSLADRVERGGRVPHERVVEWGASLARALEACHACGLVHRDVKPSNVLLDASETPHLADFGLVADTGASAITRTGDRMGTPAFMSPEQALGGAASVDHRTDVYSLGTVLYWLLTGRTPFEAASWDVLLERIRSEEPPWPRRLDPGIPADLDAIVRMAMAKEVDRRYPTAAAMADDLERHRRNEPVRARPPGRLAPLRRWMDRHRWLVRTAYAAILAGYVAAGISLYQTTRREAALETSWTEARARVQDLRDETDAGLLVAEASLAAGRPQEAADRAAAILVDYREDRLRVQVEAVLRRSGLPRTDWSSLLPELEREFETGRVRAWASHLAARALAALGLVAEAERGFFQAIVEGPDSTIVPYALLDLARLEADAGRLEDARRALDALESLEPDVRLDEGFRELRTRLASARLDLGELDDPSGLLAAFARRWERPVRADELAIADLLDAPGEELALLDGSTGRLRILAWNGTDAVERARYEVGRSPERVRLAAWPRRPGRPARLAIWSGEGPRIELFVADGSGLASEAIGPAPGLVAESRLALADLDGDGVPEVVLGAPGTVRTARVLRAASGGFVEARLPIAEGAYPLWLRVEPAGDDPGGAEEVWVATGGDPAGRATAYGHVSRGPRRVSPELPGGPGLEPPVRAPASGPGHWVAASSIESVFLGRTGEDGAAEWRRFDLVPGPYRARRLGFVRGGDPAGTALAILADRGPDRVLLVLARRDPASEGPRAAVGRSPGALERLMSLGDLALSMGLVDSGRRLYGEVLDRAEEAADPAVDRAKLGRARSIRLGGDPRRAAAVLRTGLLDPGSPVRFEAARELVFALDRSGEWTALAEFLDGWLAGEALARSEPGEREVWIRERARARALAEMPPPAPVLDPVADEPALVDRTDGLVLRSAPGLPVRVGAAVETGAPVLWFRIRLDASGLSPGDRCEIGFVDPADPDGRLLGLRLAALPDRLALEPAGWRRAPELPEDLRVRDAAVMEIEFLHVPAEGWTYLRLAPHQDGEYGEAIATGSPPGPVECALALRKVSPAPGPARIRVEEWSIAAPSPDPAPGPVDPLAAVDSLDLEALLAWAGPRAGAMPPASRRVLLESLAERLAPPGDYLDRAAAAFAAGHLLESAVLSDLATRQDERYLEALRLAGLAQARLGLFTEADRTLTRCHLAGGADPAVLAARARAREALGRPGEAADDLLAALALDPDPALRDEILAALARVRD